ncbi:MAG: hypothetical protein ACRDVW_03390 [Acidimicrobiales bacterium]
MGDLVVDGDELVLRLTRAEKFEGVHGDLRAPLSAVTGVEVLDDAHQAADMLGIKVGTRIPGVVEVATVHGARTIFAAVHRDTPRGVRVSFSGAAQDEWVIGSADPEGVTATITAAR